MRLNNLSHLRSSSTEKTLREMYTPTRPPRALASPFEVVYADDEIDHEIHPISNQYNLSGSMPGISPALSSASLSGLATHGYMEKTSYFPESGSRIALRAEDGLDVREEETSRVKIVTKHKWLLLVIFSIAQYLDVASRSSALVFVDSIARDLNIRYDTSTWILNSYGLTFGSFLLLWGRVSDLYSAKIVFVAGFFICGIISLVISLMTNQYAFFVCRALYGIAAAATIPSAFQLITLTFEPGTEAKKALSYFSLSGAVANGTGLLWGGVFGAIKLGGQGEGWRFFFRWVTLLSIPFSVLAYFMFPSTVESSSSIALPMTPPQTPGLNLNIPTTQLAPRPSKLRQLDLPGVFLALSSLLLLNTSLTIGAAHGFGSKQFIRICWTSPPVILTFIIWEWRAGEDTALIPKSLWKVRNLGLMCFLALECFAFIGVSQLAMVERYQIVHGESAIISALRLLPQGVTMTIVCIGLQPFLRKMSNLRWPITIGFAISAGSYLLLIRGGENVGADYWRWQFPGLILGAGGLAASFLGINITIMTSVSPSQAGIAGALFQTCLQTGTVIALSIQAAFLNMKPGSIANWTNVKYSFWFQMGWAAVCFLVVLLGFRAPARS